MQKSQAENLLNFRQNLEKEGILFSYSGVVCGDILHGIGQILKSMHSAVHVEKSKSKRAFALLVEQVQHVLQKPSVDDLDFDKRGFIVIGRMDDRHFISCGTVMEKDRTSHLVDILSEIAELDKAELRDLYKKNLKDDEATAEGIGFIEIARQATHGLEIGHLAVDDNNSFLCLKAYV